MSMGIVLQIQDAVSQGLNSLYSVRIESSAIQVNETKPEFEGELTVVLFSLLKPLKKSPDVLGNELGNKLLSDHPQLFSGFNVIKGFLNLSVSDKFWLNFLATSYKDPSFGFQPA